MHRTADMFPKLGRPRRVLMHVYDGDGQACFDPGDPVHVVMHCATCGHTTDWIELGLTEAKRGIPCPKCNDHDSNGEQSHDR